MTHARSVILGRRVLVSVASVALLAGLPLVLSHEVHSQESMDARRQTVVEAFARTPYRIGSWQGTDEDVPKAAIEILRPSAILSRRFTNVEDGRQATLVVVHCSDARDMAGHYPPNCYPAHGWIRDREAEEPCRLVVAGEPIPATAYRFRGAASGPPDGLRIINFFLQSDGGVTADRPVINYLRERHSRAALGIVQVQVVTSDALSFDEATDAARTLLDGVTPLLTTLAEGKIHDHANAR